jgi:hypothetical protein
MLRVTEEVSVTIPCRLMTVGFMAVVMSGTVAAQNGERPNADAGPTEVIIGVYLVDLSTIDGAHQSVTADLYVQMRWTDTRLLGPDGQPRKVRLRDVWYPLLEILNQRDLKTARPETLEVQADGTVVYRQRYSGEFAARMLLRDFPFDSQTLEFRVVVAGYTPDDIRLVVDPRFSGRFDPVSVPDWAVGAAEVVEDPIFSPGAERQIVGATLTVPASRRVGFYVGKAFASVAIIVAMGWVVFWIPGQYVPPRVSVSVTAMLTLIAYRFLLGSVLPPVPYLTRMDWFLLGSTLLVFIGLVGVVADLHLGEAAAKRLDRIMKVAYPAAFVVLTVAVAAV